MFTKLLHEFWRDEVGATVTLEHVMVGTVGTLGLVGGIASTSNALNDELNDFARAIRSFDQSYAVSGYSSDGFIQTGQPGCLNNGGISTGTSFQAYKAGSGFRQTSTSVTSGRAQFSSLPNQVVQDADVAGTNGLRMRIEDDQPQFVAPQAFQTQQFNAIAQPVPGVLIQPRQECVVVDADGVIVEEEVTEHRASGATQRKQATRASREHDQPSATKETKSRRKDR